MKTDIVLQNFVKDNKIFIYGDFDESIAINVLPELLNILNVQVSNKKGLIKFYINSNGGETSYLYNLLAIIERAKVEGVTIETFVFGNAFSCGSLLASAGTKGSRYISDTARYFCHIGNGSGYTPTTKEQVDRIGKYNKAHFDTIYRLYEKYANIKELRKAMTDNMYFITGKDIIKNGLADKMYDKVV